MPERDKDNWGPQKFVNCDILFKNQARIYSRQTYGIFSFISDIGGLFGALIGLFQIIVNLFGDRIFQYELLTESMGVKKPSSLSDEVFLSKLQTPSQEQALKLIEISRPAKFINQSIKRWLAFTYLPLCFCDRKYSKFSRLLSQS